MNQSKLEGKTYCRREAPEHVCERVTIGFVLLLVGCVSRQTGRAGSDERRLYSQATYAKARSRLLTLLLQCICYEFTIFCCCCCCFTSVVIARHSNTTSVLVLQQSVENHICFIISQLFRKYQYSRGGSRNFLKGGLYTIVVTFNAKNNFIQLFFRKNKKKITKKFCPKGGLQPPSPLPWIRLCIAYFSEL